MNLCRNICFNMLIIYDPRIVHFLLIVPKRNSDPNIVKNTSNAADLNDAHKYMQLEPLLCSLANTRLLFPPTQLLEFTRTSNIGIASILISNRH